MTKTFTIGEAVPNPHTPGTYEFEIETMSGDADAFGKVIVGPLTDIVSLISLAETLDRMKAQYPYGRGGSWPEYGYQDVEGFYSWFEDAEISNEEEYHEEHPESNVPYSVYLEHKALVGDLYNEWPWDVMGADIEQGMWSYKIFYYDTDLVQHFVKWLDS